MMLPIQTARMVVAQVLICQGCCCGRTDRGRPPVPFDWIKQQWKERKLAKHVQLTLSGCLGPCDVPNVVLLLTATEKLWLGRLTSTDHYAAVIEWAAETARHASPQRLPDSLLSHRFSPFIGALGSDTAGQSCGSIGFPAAVDGNSCTLAK